MSNGGAANTKGMAKAPTATAVNDTPVDDDDTEAPHDPSLPPGHRGCPKTERTTLYRRYGDVLEPIPATVDNRVVCLFYRFCAERHAMFERGEAGAARDALTDDDCMMNMRVGNVFRQLDRGSLNMLTNVISVGDQSHTEVVCE